LENFIKIKIASLEILRTKFKPTTEKPAKTFLMLKSRLKVIFEKGKANFKFGVLTRRFRFV
jgi:hypothetical protein